MILDALLYFTLFLHCQQASKIPRERTEGGGKGSVSIWDSIDLLAGGEDFTFGPSICFAHSCSLIVLCAMIICSAVPEMMQSEALAACEVLEYMSGQARDAVFALTS